jgi:hypothetical protein
MKKQDIGRSKQDIEFLKQDIEILDEFPERINIPVRGYFFIDEETFIPIRVYSYRTLHKKVPS